MRREQTCERLKRKAEREGKSVRVDDGVLYINDTALFSVREGFLNRSMADPKLALSSIFGKILDNIILVRCQQYLISSDLIFGFKR